MSPSAAPLCSAGLLDLPDAALSRVVLALQKHSADSPASALANLRASCQACRQLVNSHTTRLRLQPGSCAVRITPPLSERFSNASALDLSEFDKDELVQQLPELLPGAAWPAITTLVLPAVCDLVAAFVALALPAVHTIKLRNCVLAINWRRPFLRHLCWRLPQLAHLSLYDPGVNYTSSLDGEALRLLAHCTTLQSIRMSIECTAADMQQLWHLTRLTALNLFCDVNDFEEPGTAWMQGISSLVCLQSLTLNTDAYNTPSYIWPQNAAGLAQGLSALTNLARLHVPSLPNASGFELPLLTSVHFINLTQQTVRSLCCFPSLLELYTETVCEAFHSHLLGPLTALTSLDFDTTMEYGRDVRFVQFAPALVTLYDVGGSLFVPTLQGLQHIRRLPSCHIQQASDYKILAEMPALHDLDAHLWAADNAALTMLTQLETANLALIDSDAFGWDAASIAACLKAISCLPKLHTLRLDVLNYRNVFDDYSSVTAMDAGCACLAQAPALQYLYWCRTPHCSQGRRTACHLTNERLSSIAQSSTLERIEIFAEAALTAAHCNDLVAEREQSGGRSLTITTLIW